MKVLVTGGTGFIGSNLVDFLLEKGYEVSCLIRPNSNLQWLSGKNINFIKSDFNNFDDLKDILSAQSYIYHLAGQIAANTEQDYIDANVIVTQKLLNAVKKYNSNLKRFLFMGSQTSVGPSLQLNTPVDELSVSNPITAYGRSKKLAEEVVNSMSNSIPITIVRSPAVYGPRDKATLPIFKFANKGIGLLIGLNKKYLSSIYVRDLVEGTVLAAESNNSIGQTYFISADGDYSWDQLIDAIKLALGRDSIFRIRIPDSIILGLATVSQMAGKLLGFTPVFNYEKGLDMVQNYWICSNNKAKKEIGFVNNYELEEGMKETMLWYKNHNWL